MSILTQCCTDDKKSYAVLPYLVASTWMNLHLAGNIGVVEDMSRHIEAGALCIE